MGLPFLNETRQRMVDDDSYMDVSPDDVKALLLHLKRHGYHDLVRKMRIKYGDLIDDREKRVMVELGITYDGHDVQIDRGGQITIDGYTIAQWKALFTDDYPISHDVLMRFIAMFDKANNTWAAERLREKYATVLDERTASRLSVHGVSASAKQAESVDRRTIDGEIPSIWKAINDPNYTPTQSTLTVILRTLEERGDDEAAQFVYDKYQDIFYYDDGPVELQHSFEEIQAFLDTIAGYHIDLKRWSSNEYRKKKSPPA